MESLKLKSIALVIIVTISSLAPAASVSLDAKAEELWTGTAFVIVARIVDVRHREGEAMQYFDANLRPIVCVAGLFNPAEHPTMKVECDASAGHPEWLHPAAGDLVLAVVYDRTKLGVPREGFALAGGSCWFMPRNQAMVQLKGMDDPGILDVLHKMQAAHPTTAPAATQPTHAG